MPATAVTPIAVPQNYDTAGAAAAWTAVDVANGNSVEIAVGESLILIVRNTSGSTTRNFTVTSVADPTYGRTGNITLALGAGLFRVFRLTSIGWATNGVIAFSGDNAELEVLILRM